MRDVQADIFAGVIHPGQLSIVREIRYDSEFFDTDTAVFTGLVQDYLNEVVFLEDGSFLLLTTDTVAARDGADILRNIEQVRFADATFILQDNGNFLPDEFRFLTLDDDTPTEDQQLTVSADGHPRSQQHLERLPRSPGRSPTSGRSSSTRARASSPTSCSSRAARKAASPARPSPPGDEEVGLRLRVRAMYEDEAGVLEEVFSQPTQASRTSTTRPPAR